MKNLDLNINAHMTRYAPGIPPAYPPPTLPPPPSHPEHPLLSQNSSPSKISGKKFWMVGSKTKILEKIWVNRGCLRMYIVYEKKFWGVE